MWHTIDTSWGFTLREDNSTCVYRNSIHALSASDPRDLALTSREGKKEKKRDRREIEINESKEIGRREKITSREIELSLLPLILVFRTLIKLRIQCHEGKLILRKKLLCVYSYARFSIFISHTYLI